MVAINKLIAYQCADELIENDHFQSKCPHESSCIKDKLAWMTEYH